MGSENPAPPGIPASLVWSGATRNLLPLLRFCTFIGLSLEKVASHLSMPAPPIEISRPFSVFAPASPLPPKLPTPGYGPAFGFLNRLPVYSSLALQVYFTPQPRPGFTLQGFSLRCSRATSSMTLCPLVVSPRPLLPACADSAKNAAPPSGLCSAPESVASRKGLALVKPDPLLSFSSYGCSLSRSSHRLHSSSALGLCSRGVGSAP